MANKPIDNNKDQNLNKWMRRHPQKFVKYFGTDGSGSLSPEEIKDMYGRVYAYDQRHNKAFPKKFSIKGTGDGMSTNRPATGLPNVSGFASGMSTTPAGSGTQNPPLPPNNQLPKPPTSVGEPGTLPPPTTTVTGGTTALSAPDPTSTTTTTDPGATGTTPTDPSNGSDATGGEGTDSTATNPLEAGGIPANTTNDGSEGLGPQIGAAPGSTEQENAINRQNQFYGKLADREKEKKEFNNNRPSGRVEDVSIGKAAQKSAAMLAFDLNQDGKLGKIERSMMASGDQNNNGVVGKKGLENFVAAADTNKSGLVSVSEANTYHLKDVNDNNKVSKVEQKAYDKVAGADGDISKKEARQFLKAQAQSGAPSKVDKTAKELAKDILAKSDSSKIGGSLSDAAQNGALAGGAGQMAKSKNQNEDGLGKKKNKNKQPRVFFDTCAVTNHCFSSLGS